MHAHINPGDIGENELLSEKDKQAAQGVLDQMLQQYLDFGVTTLRDPAGGPANLKLRDDVETGRRLADNQNIKDSIE